jgi:hypothetical protein
MMAGRCRRKSVASGAGHLIAPGFPRHRAGHEKSAPHSAIALDTPLDRRRRRTRPSPPNFPGRRLIGQAVKTLGPASSAKITARPQREPVSVDVARDQGF